jgi:hypothetical protein
MRSSADIRNGQATLGLTLVVEALQLIRNDLCCDHNLRDRPCHIHVSSACRTLLTAGKICWLFPISWISSLGFDPKLAKSLRLFYSDCTKKILVLYRRGN